MFHFIFEAKQGGGGWRNPLASVVFSLCFFDAVLYTYILVLYCFGSTFFFWVRAEQSRGPSSTNETRSALSTQLSSGMRPSWPPLHSTLQLCSLVAWAHEARGRGSRAI